MELPVVDSVGAERADAARNRRRILAAAERLFAEHGVHRTTMDAIAIEAGVGKGTLFRRFGDRASLALAVLDETERTLQEEILRGAPPLGPGAPPRERLIAFGDAILDRTEQHSELMLEAELTGGMSYLRSSPRAARWLHVRTLVEQAGTCGDPDYLADVLIGALGAPLYVHQRFALQREPEQLKAGFAALVERLLS